MLGVERSLLGKRWRARLADSMAGLSLAQAIEAPELVGRVPRGPWHRGQKTRRTTSTRLCAGSCPTRSTSRTWRGPSRASPAHWKAGEKIAIFGDYDVDGATSAALLCRFPRGPSPTRRRSISPTACARATARTARPCACWPRRTCAWLSRWIAESAPSMRWMTPADAGLDVIVVDHHVAEARLPQACAVIDPNRLGRREPAPPASPPWGVAFLLVVGAQPPPARGRLVPRPGGAGPPAMARSGGARHRLRRGAAHRGQPRLRAPGAHDDAATPQRGAQGAR